MIGERFVGQIGSGSVPGLQKTTPKANEARPLWKSFRDYLGGELDTWNRGSRDAQAHLAGLPSQFRALLSLQQNMQTAGVKLHLTVNAAEALNQTIRKLQQSGGS